MKVLTLALISMLLFMGSCAPVINSKAGSGGQDTGSAVQTAPPGQSPDSYYDFEDILLPKEMKLVPSSSLLFETPQIKAGVICFEGRVDPVSLFDFFVENMPKDNWQLRSYFKYGRYILVFEKPDKDCIININEKTLTTSLELWVTPRLTQ